MTFIESITQFRDTVKPRLEAISAAIENLRGLAGAIPPECQQILDDISINIAGIAAQCAAPTSTDKEPL